MNWNIHKQRNDELARILEVHRMAFGSSEEADLVKKLVDEGFDELGLVAEVDQQLVGHILFSKVTIATETGVVDSLSLAPLAVIPTHQRQGLGTRLTHAGIEICRKQGHHIVLVLGHPEFYVRFGFSAELARPLSSPFGGGEAWMALELAAGALAGIHGDVHFSPPFNALGTEN